MQLDWMGIKILKMPQTITSISFWPYSISAYHIIPYWPSSKHAVKGDPVRVKGNSGVCPSIHSTRGRETAWRGHQSITGKTAQTVGKEKPTQVWEEHTHPRARAGIKACLNNINLVLPWCNGANYRGSHVDIADILTWNNSTHFIWKYWINATDCIFNEMSFRTFPSCSVCKLGCPQSVRDRLWLISITTAAAQSLKTRKLGLNILKEGPGV